MMLDGISMVVMTLPIVLPIVLLAGFDGLWFGIFLVFMVEMLVPIRGFFTVCYSKYPQVNPLVLSSKPRFLFLIMVLITAKIIVS